jgi:hypothetical protein
VIAMNEAEDMQQLEDDLELVLAERVPRRLDFERMRWRMRRARTLAASATAIWVAFLIASALVFGTSPWIALVALLLLRAGHSRFAPQADLEVSASSVSAELLQLERKHLERRLLQLRLAVASDLLLAALCGASAIVSAAPIVLALFAAGFAGQAAATTLLMATAVRRELADLGQPAPRGALFTLALLGILVLGPFVVLWGIVSRLVRRTAFPRESGERS